jgi:preprotein translocase subunit SecF
MRFLRNTKIDFLGKKWIAYIFSGLLVVSSIVLTFTSKPNWGIDFTGGSLIHMEFKQKPDIKELREIFNKSGLEGVEIQKFTNEKVVMVRVRKDYENALEEVNSALEGENLADNDYTVLRNEMIGPSVGVLLREKAVKAFVFAFLAIILYVAWRFKGGIWGIAAVLALVHDVVVTFGILNYLGVTLNLPVIAALLTLAGYSINDTIVVYDRIRENLKVYFKDPLDKIINRSINETLSRTIVTSGTTLVVVLALFFKGGEVLRGFSLTLLIGIIIGTYSSIFIASPLVYLWKSKK